MNICISGDYTSALLVLLEMSSLLESGPLTGTQTDVLLRCEFSQVFLLLILRPAAQRLATPLVKLLEKYMWGNANDMSVRGKYNSYFYIIEISVCFILLGLYEYRAYMMFSSSRDVRTLIPPHAVTSNVLSIAGHGDSS